MSELVSQLVTRVNNAMIGLGSDKNNFKDESTKMSENGESYTTGKKNYTAAGTGSDGSVKSHLSD